ncbi:MAG: hypothetical protein J6X18_08755 [Bacteroidales bacterium]|nr:hypothetical protein [Bacteroidales bacterium]
MKRIAVDFEIEVPDEISEGAVDCALEEFLEHTLPDCLEVEDYRINGRFVNEQ